jgi:hypothetical protein
LHAMPLRVTRISIFIVFLFFVASIYSLETNA